MSPVSDLEAIGESYDTNSGTDPLFHRDFVQGLMQGFLGPAGDPRDPLASPLHADLTGLGPVCIQVGGDETLLDDARSLDDHARKAGLDTRLDVFPGMLHTFQMAAGRARKPTTPSARWPPGSAPGWACEPHLRRWVRG